VIGVLSVGGPEEMRVKRETERAKRETEQADPHEGDNTCNKDARDDKEARDKKDATAEAHARDEALKRWRMQAVRKALPKMSRTNLVMIFANLLQYLQTRPLTHSILALASCHLFPLFYLYVWWVVDVNPGKGLGFRV